MSAPNDCPASYAPPCEPGCDRACPVGGELEPTADLPIAEYTELEMITALWQDYKSRLDLLQSVAADVCCDLDSDGGMNPVAHKRLCRLAMLVGCSHLPWWNKDFES